MAERSLQAYYAELARIGAEARIEAGEVLWREGDPGDTVALVLDGTLEVVHPSPGGEEEVVLRTVDGGAVVGELAGSDGRARSATVRARTPCRLLKIPAPAFRLLLRQRPDILEELYGLQIERVAFGETVRQAVEGTSFAGGPRQPGGRMTVSAGVATFPWDAQSEEALIKAADDNLYKAKEAGRNRVVAAETVAPAAGATGRLS